MATSLKNIPFNNYVPTVNSDGAFSDIRLTDGCGSYVKFEYCSMVGMCGAGVQIYDANCNSLPVANAAWAGYASCAMEASAIGASWTQNETYHYASLSPCVDCFGNINSWTGYDSTCGQQVYIGIAASGIGMWASSTYGESFSHLIYPCFCYCGDSGYWCTWDGTWYDSSCGQTIYTSIMYACYADCAVMACSLQWGYQGCSMYLPEYGIQPVCGNDYAVTYYDYCYCWSLCGCIYTAARYLNYVDSVCTNHVLAPCYQTNSNGIALTGFADMLCAQNVPIGAQYLRWDNDGTILSSETITYSELTANPGNYKVIVAKVS